MDKISEQAIDDLDAIEDLLSRPDEVVSRGSKSGDDVSLLLSRGIDQTRISAIVLGSPTAVGCLVDVIEAVDDISKIVDRRLRQIVEKILMSYDLS